MCINFKLIALELSIVLVPLYSLVYLTDKMFDIAFILAAALVVSSSIENLPSKKCGCVRVVEGVLNRTDAIAGIV